MWDGAPPETVTSALYSYITRLRADLRQVGATIRRAGPHGYLLDMEPESVDVHRLRALASRAAETGSLELWQDVCASASGEVLAGITGQWAREFRDGFGQERLGWLDARYAAELAAGNHAVVADELTARAAAESLTEPLVGHLMLALYRAGRQVEALRWFEATRLRLRDGLGADPSPTLRDLHVRILGQDRDLLDAAKDEAAVPAMLPAGIASFTGRAAQLDALSELAGGRAPVLLTGHAGAGKTALVVHWGRSHVDDFPDGVLYVNLRGFDRGETIAPRDALGRLLLALGIAGEEVPDDVDAAAELYRARTNGRRILVVLDNAGAAEQIRPLLPGEGCFTVVTSRDKLPGLIAVDDARVINVDVLPREDSALLLRRLLGDVPEIDAIAALCGDLPLALRIAAANIASAFSGRIASYVEELERDRLALLAVDGDVDVAVTAALDLSLADLDKDARLLFARLGAVPGDDVGEALAVAVSGLEPETARRSLRRLAARHLVEAYKAGRYRMHDLVRLHAAALGEGYREEVVERFIGFHEADGDVEDLDEELNVLTAAEALKGHPGLWRLVRRLKSALSVARFVDRSRAAARNGLRQAERDGDAAGVFHMTVMLAAAASAEGDIDTCLARLRTAVDLADELGPKERILVRGTLGLRMLDRDHRVSAAWLEEAAGLAAGAGDVDGRIKWNLNLTHVYPSLGAFGKAGGAYDTAVEAIADSGTERYRVWSAVNRDWLLLSRWADEELLERSEETRALTRGRGLLRFEAHVGLHRSVALRRLGRVTEALAEIRECRAILSAGRMVLLRPDLELANAYTAIGEPGSALDLLAAVERAWPTMPWLDRADFDLALATAHRGAGELDTARAHAEKAASTYGAIVALVPQAEALDVLAGILRDAGREAGAAGAEAKLAAVVAGFEAGWCGPGSSTKDGRVRDFR